MTRSQRSLRLVAALAAGLGLASAALAGPPLICHPFVTDAEAPLLPWADGRGWRLPDPAYDVTRLVDDTLTLLSAEAPIVARMENMRRATIYADTYPEIAAALLHAVVSRTASAPENPQAAALEWFDAGYLVETYRQLGLVYEHGMLRGHGPRLSLSPELAALDGYALVQKALALAPEAAAELEFAASLMTREPLTAAHRERAAAAAKPGSLLAQNLAHFE
jgi:hypothetical protein